MDEEVDARLRRAELRARRLEGAAREALARSDAATAHGDTAAAALYESAASQHVDDLLAAERQISDLRGGEPGRSDPKPVGVSAFISYSRHDYYFAESLHAALVASPAVRPWMDVAELGLGEDWARSIDAALDAADVVVLVSSPAAAASSQVAREWRAARDRGIPIVVAAAGWSPLDPDLDPAAVHDLRADFRRGSEAVNRSILAAAAGNSDRPAATPIRRAYRAAPPVLALEVFIALDLVAVGLALACAGATVVSPLQPVVRLESGVLGTGTFTFSGPAAYGPVLLCAAMAALMCQHLIAVVRRRFKPRVFAVDVFFQVVLFALMALLLQLLDRRRLLSPIELPPPIDFATTIGPAVLVVLGASALITLVVVLRSTAVLRISRTGYHLERTRRRITGEDAGHDEALDMPWPSADDGAITRISGKMLLGDPKRRTFRLLHDNQDAGTAAVIRRTCTAAGLREDAAGYWSIQVVSNLTDLASLDRPDRRSDGRYICVLTTPVAIPDDADLLRQLQWLDFRRRDVGALQSLLRGMTGRSSDVELLPLPIDPAQFRPPALVNGGAYNPLVLLAVAAAVSIAIALAPGVGASWVWPVAIGIAFSVMCARLSAGIASRTYTAARFRRDGLIWVAALVCCIGTLLATASPSPVVTVGYLLVLVPIAVTARLTHRGLRQWWLLSRPVPGGRTRMPPLDQYGPMITLLFGMVLTMVTGVRVAPATELYVSTGAALGALYPITALPESIQLNNHDSIYDLRWTEVDPDRAVAHGTVAEIVCEPNCAEGTYTTSTVEVVATEPVECVFDVHPDYSDGYYTEQRTIFTSVVARTDTGAVLPYALGGEVNPPRCPGD
jgi:hypothetical protein